VCFRAGKPLTTAEIISLLDKDFFDGSVYIYSPENAALSDCDSEADNPIFANVNHLSGDSCAAKLS